MPTVLFDEFHSAAWTIRPELAREMQPAHPADASYAAAAEAIAARDFAVAINADGPLTAGALSGVDVLVIAHPSERKWERTTSEHSPRLSAEELDAIEAFVAAGGGLIVLGETEQDKYGANLNDLVSRFGIEIAHDTVQDYERSRHAPSWILADLDEPAIARGLLSRVDELCFYRAGSLRLSPQSHAAAFAFASPSATSPGAPLAAVARHGAGRVAVFADSDLFGDDCLGESGHAALWVDLIHWVAAHAFAVPARPAAIDDVSGDPAWLALKAAVEELRALQEADGSVDTTARGLSPFAHVEAVAAGVRALAPRFAHQAAYLEAAVDDLERWARDGFGRPDFGPSLELFRPERGRRDGAEHLVLFAMYKQNGSRDTCFEALVVRVPWPERVAALERTRYDNPKFVPVEFVDFTSGYDSECAVLFPETVSVAGAPANHFGAIFCDREAERFRRVVSRAAGILGLALPPDAQALLASETLSRDAYVVWDLIHDRAHSHGDLPFDPFMIRQRMPYWMYSLEELRCDLTAFGEAVALEREGHAYARHVQYAILFDRLFRFPITGTRVRNYDGLGGQLLFAYLHRQGLVHWTDNRLSIEWDRVGGGVMALRERVEELYRTGIDRSKLAHWCAAHDLVAEFVAPAAASRWVKGVRDFADVEDPRPYIDLVRDDEFPLSIFYTSLKQKLEAAPEPAPLAA